MNKFLSETGHALAALSLSILGIALSPQVSNVLPQNVALALTIAGVAYQGFTGKAVTLATPAAPAPAAPAPAAQGIQIPDLPAPAPLAR